MQWPLSLTPARQRKQPRRHPASFVPRLEPLDSRDVPATLIASGLEGAQGSVVGPGGDLFVTESITGTLSRIDPRTGAVSTVVTGLPTGPYAGFGGGAVDVAFLGNTPYVLVVDVAFDVGGTDVVGIYRVDGPTSFTVIADIGTWSVEHPPATNFFLPTGNGYALEPFRGGFLVTDGHHNRVLEVRLDGQITEVIAFDNIVPTGLEVRGNTVYLAQAGPVPHLAEDGVVVSFDWNNPTATEVASGAPLLVDVEFGPGNTLYALAQGDWDSEFEGDPALPNTGALVRVNGDGTFTFLEEGLDRPTSLEFIGNTAYVVNLAGEVWRFDNVSDPPYTGESLTAASLPSRPTARTIDGDKIQPLVKEALARWNSIGVDTSDLRAIDVRIGDLGGTTLGMAAGNTIWLDDNAAGWGWFVDRTPRNDSEFWRAGNQGERNRMDLLTVLAHEVGHLLGHDHEETGVMTDTLTAGTRRVPSGGIGEVTRLDGAAFSGHADQYTYWIGGTPFGRARAKR